MTSDTSRIPIKVALTIDDLFQWKGMPALEGYSYQLVAQRLIDAFANHRARGVYAFSNTAPVENSRALAEVFDSWVEAGHHVGNHTHNHASLNMVAAKDYIEDIEKTEPLIGRWLQAAPKRYFRHCYDTYGDTAEKRDEVMGWLGRAGYTVAPGSMWFYDWPIALAYQRAIVAGDTQAKASLRQIFVDTAVKQLRVQANAARQVFGRDPVHIWLVHGTPMTADCIGAVLDAFAAHGVEFVSLEEGLAEQMNREQPLLTSDFLNQVQKWSAVKGVTIEDCPPAILAEVENVCILPGMSSNDIYGKIFTDAAAVVSAKS